MPLAHRNRRINAERRRITIWTLVAIWLLSAAAVPAQEQTNAPPAVIKTEYKDHRALSAELQELATAHPALVRVKERAYTHGKREVWSVELGAGSDDDRKLRPGILVIAGIEGDDLVGSAAALYWLHSLVSQYDRNPAVHGLLETTTIYVFPRVNPDATENYFARPRVETKTNLTPTDDDHDGLIDEDGPEDLNADGLVTSMRVEDPEGPYIADALDGRVLIKADSGKGEKGRWKLFSEGIDNDKDEQWNEDAIGGVNLNRNFPFQYQYFGPGSGVHQVSEPETRALADFIVKHPNIAIAFTFGAVDNLVQTPKGEPGGKRPPTAVSENDLPYYRELGRVYREAQGLKKELKGNSEPGTVSDWIYFHRGRISLAARAWTPALEIEISKAGKSDEKKLKDAPAADRDTPAVPPSEPKERLRGESADAKSSPPEEHKAAKDDKADDKRGEEERAQLKWFDENAPESFVAWKEFKHPDFPGQKVEIGGWAPFAQSNPPVKLLDPVCQRHARFLTDLAGRVPRIGFRKALVKPLGLGVYELTLRIENTGYLPTALAQGTLTREVLRTRVVLKLEDRQILAGERMTFLGPLRGSGGMDELRYVVQTDEPITVEVISALGGSIHRTLPLRDSP